MKILHLPVLLLYVFSFGLVGCRDDNNLEPTQTETIVCVGNSLTEGYGLGAGKSYPAILQKQLGNSYIVKNLGVSGATLLRKGDKTYWGLEEYQQAQQITANIVIIELGTNDSKRENWRFRENFKHDYIELISSFQRLPSSPSVYICKPPPVFRENFGIQPQVIKNEINPLLEEVIEEMDVKLIDLYQPFINKGALFPDGVHPNEVGASLMATEVGKAITNK